MIKSLSFDSGYPINCAAGTHYSEAFGGCVSDDGGSTGGSTGGATADPNFMKYALMGLAALLLIGAFAGGRASKKSKTGALLSRTTTKSIFG